MTALRKYDRLECPGLWRDSADARRRDVVVALGETTLVLSDPKSNLVLAHWSLPAVGRLNPGEVPALFGPAPDAPETLELSDPYMVAALDEVQRALQRRKARPGRLRGVLLTSGAVAVLGVGVLWIPGALVSHTAAVLPAVTRAEIGQSALADLSRLTGPPCAGPLGKRAAQALAERLFGSGPARIEVVRDGLNGALSLPGGIIVLGRPLIELPPDAETAAGFAIAQAASDAALDPMIPLLTYAGLPATLTLLTTGSLPQGALRGYGEVLLARPPADPAVDGLILRFGAADVSARAYAYARDPSGITTLPLIEADPYRDGSPRPVLADGDWISLQAICAT